MRGMLALGCAWLALAAGSAASAAPASSPSWYVITQDVVGNAVTALGQPDRDVGRLRGFVLTSPGGEALYAIIDVDRILGMGAGASSSPMA